MKAVLIDPRNRVISEIEADPNNFKMCAEILECELVEQVQCASNITLLVDECGQLKQNQHYFFYGLNFEPFAGRALLFEKNENKIIETTKYLVQFCALKNLGKKITTPAPGHIHIGFRYECLAPITMIEVLHKDYYYALPLFMARFAVAIDKLNDFIENFWGKFGYIPARDSIALYMDEPLWIEVPVIPCDSREIAQAMVDKSLSPSPTKLQ